MKSPFISLGKFVDILYPRRCVLCDSVLKKDEPLVCRSCAKEVSFIKERCCAHCGKILKSRYEDLCDVCGHSRRVFDEAAAPFSYSGAVRDSIFRFKDSGRAEYAAFYAKCIYEYTKERIKRWNADTLVPVPLYEDKLHKRGYNQAELLAAELSKLTGIPVDNSLVRRTKNTAAQKDLNAAQRRSNLMSAFTLARGAAVPEGVIIVDDIFTTGSTLDCIASVLKDGCARHVYALCISVS